MASSRPRPTRTAVSLLTHHNSKSSSAVMLLPLTVQQLTLEAVHSSLIPRLYMTKHSRTMSLLMQMTSKPASGLCSPRRIRVSAVNLSSFLLLRRIHSTAERLFGGTRSGGYFCRSASFSTSSLKIYLQLGRNTSPNTSLRLAISSAQMTSSPLRSVTTSPNSYMIDDSASSRLG